MAGQLTPINLEWVSPGPVSTAFVDSDAAWRLLMGPYGSGKTTTAIFDKVFRAFRQPRSPIDGKRRYRFSVVRDTYNQIGSNLLPSWWEYFPKELGKWKGEAPYKHTIELIHPDDQGIVIMEADFFGLGEHRVEDVMKGYQGTDAWIDEADRLARVVLEFVRGRNNRYQPMKHGGPYATPSISLTFNAPPITNHLHDMAIDNPLPNLEFFRQPSGLSPQAENLANLPAGYYEDLAADGRAWFVRRFVTNKWGFSRDGMPVYENFNEDFHIAPDNLKPHPMLPIFVGADAGRRPAAIFFQKMPNGQRRVLSELWMLNAGARLFGEAFNAHVAEHYPGYRIYAWRDPATESLTEISEETWGEIVSDVTKIDWEPCPVSNKDTTTRIGCLEYLFTHNTHDGQPMVLISKRCRKLAAALASGYRYKKLNVISEERYSREIDKNDHSHGVEGWQYGELGSGEFVDVAGRDETYGQFQRPSQVVDGTAIGRMGGNGRRRGLPVQVAH